MLDNFELLSNVDEVLTGKKTPLKIVQAYRESVLTNLSLLQKGHKLGVLFKPLAENSSRVADALLEYYKINRELSWRQFEMPESVIEEFEVVAVLSREGADLEVVPLHSLIDENFYTHKSFSKSVADKGAELFGIYPKNPSDLERVRVLFNQYPGFWMLASSERVYLNAVDKSYLDNQYLKFRVYDWLECERLNSEGAPVLHPESFLKIAFGGDIDRLEQACVKLFGNKHTNPLLSKLKSEDEQAYIKALKQRILGFLSTLSVDVDLAYRNHLNELEIAKYEQSGLSKKEIDDQRAGLLSFIQESLSNSDSSPEFQNWVYTHMLDDSNGTLSPYYDLKKPTEMRVQHPALPYMIPIDLSGLDYYIAEEQEILRMQSILYEYINTVLGLIGRDHPLYSTHHSFFTELALFLGDRLALFQSMNVVNRFITASHINADYVTFGTRFFESYQEYYHQIFNSGSPGRIYMNAIGTPQGLKNIALSSLLLAAAQYASETRNGVSKACQMFKNRITKIRETACKDTNSEDSEVFNLLEMDILRGIFEITEYDHESINKYRMLKIERDGSVEVTAPKIPNWDKPRIIAFAHLPKNLQQKKAVVDALSKYYSPFDPVCFFIPSYYSLFLNSESESLKNRMMAKDFGYSFHDPKDRVQNVLWDMSTQEAVLTVSESTDQINAYKLPILRNCFHSGSDWLGVLVNHTPVTSEDILRSIKDNMTANPAFYKTQSQYSMDDEDDDDSYGLFAVTSIAMYDSSSAPNSFINAINHLVSNYGELSALHAMMGDIDFNPSAQAFKESSVTEQNLQTYLRLLDDQKIKKGLFYDTIYSLVHEKKLIVPIIRYNPPNDKAPTLQEILNTEIPSIPRAYLRCRSQSAIFIPCIPKTMENVDAYHHVFVSGDAKRGSTPQLFNLSRLLNLPRVLLECLDTRLLKIDVSSFFDEGGHPDNKPLQIILKELEASDDSDSGVLSTAFDKNWLKTDLTFILHKYYNTFTKIDGTALIVPKFKEINTNNDPLVAEKYVVTDWFGTETVVRLKG